jgi:HNH endonuclease
MWMNDRDIPGFPGYKLRQLGENDWQIIGKHKRPMKLWPVNTYLSVVARISGRSRFLALHRAIALVHHADTWFEGAWVDHKDRDKTNNRIDNLRWATPSINCLNYDKSARRTPEYRAKIRTKSTRLWQDAEFRRKCCTPENRAKMSAGAKKLAAGRKSAA